MQTYETFMRHVFEHGTPKTENPINRPLGEVKDKAQEVADKARTTASNLADKARDTGRTGVN